MSGLDRLFRGYGGIVCSRFTLITAAGATGILIGIVSGILSPYGPIALLCVLGLTYLLKVPNWLVPVALIVCSSPITSADYLPRIALSEFSLEIQDIFLVFLAIAISTLAICRKKLPWCRLDTIVLGFVSVAIVSFLTAILHGVALMVALRQLLIVLAMPVAYWLVRILGSESKHSGIPFMKALLGVAFISSLVIIVQYLLSSVGSGIYIVASRFISQRTADLLTIRTPGQGLLLVSSILWCSSLFKSDTSLWAGFPSPRVVFALITLLGFVLQFPRHGFLGLGTALLLSIVFGKKRELGTVAKGILVFVLLVGVFVLFVPEDSRRWIVQVFTFHGLSQDTSSQWRLMELGYAFRAFSRSPIVGIGLGADYRPQFFLERMGEFGWKGTNYVHSALVWWILDTGIVGFGVLLVLALNIIKTMAVGTSHEFLVAVALLGNAASTLAAPSWMSSSADGVVIGVLLGILATMKTSRKVRNGSVIAERKLLGEGLRWLLAEYRR